MNSHNTQAYQDLHYMFLRMWTAVGIAHDNGELFPYVKRDWKDLDSAIYAAVTAGDPSAARAVQGRASGHPELKKGQTAWERLLKAD